MTFRTALVASSLIALLPAASSAQSHARHVDSYGDLAGRKIKALSDAEIASLLAGEGAGFALAAELNGVPGPKHVLELASELELSEEQRARVESIRAAMAERAVRLGRELVDAEAALDQVFRHGAEHADHVAGLIRAAGDARTRLREAHLLAHLETASALSTEQVVRYAELRGYVGGASPSGS